jgi:hypothetical protein
MFGAAVREITPNLTPSDKAVSILKSNKRGGSITHHTKRCFHRGVNRRPENKDFDCFDADRGGMRSIHV